MARRATARGPRFSELRTLNIELRIAFVASQARPAPIVSRER